MKGKPVFSLTVADFFNAPTGKEVNLSTYSGAVGDLITIRAYDDFKVNRLQVKLSGVNNGEQIEIGEAVETPPASGRWIYRRRKCSTLQYSSHRSDGKRQARWHR